MIGNTIDERYRIEAIIGRGGMGSVYRTSDLVEKRQVALKFLHAYLDGKTDTALTRFQREFRVLAQLDHPGVVKAYGRGVYQDVPYLVLEFLVGQPLNDVLKAKGALPRPRLLQIALQICNALLYLHNKSIVHRDLKPGNLMLLPPEDAPLVKLMDFGLVRSANLSQQLTQEGTALGTVAYMAPEQAQALPVDFRADLYALGIILYEMATGRTPFVHENQAVVLMQQLTTPPPPPSEFNPDIDQPLEKFILQLLAKEPSERPVSTEAVRRTLAHLADRTAPFVVETAKRVDVIPRIPTIGRSAVLQELHKHWTATKTGQNPTILLSGVAGVGKSRLLTEMSLQVRLDRGKYMRTVCREHASLPYQPLIDALSDLPPDIQEQLPAEIARLLPGARNREDQLAHLDPAEAKQRLFATFHELLNNKAKKQPMMLIFEDAQWADPTTLELLGYIARHVSQSPIMLILTYRSEEVESNKPLTTLLRDLQRNPATYSLKLELLTREQVNAFLQAALCQDTVPPWLVDSFHLATDGNPLFIEETLKALAAEGKIAEWANQAKFAQAVSQPITPSSLTLQLPQNVLALAERRLLLLSDEDRTTLTAAAILGPEFSFTLLQGITKLSEDDLLDGIDRLLATRLIEELPLLNGEDRYRFSQEALRQALLGNISQRRRRRLHKHAGETMQTLYDTGQGHHWPVLAYHFNEAGDMDNAFKYSILAGDAAAKAHANLEAAAHYSQALELLKSTTLKVCQTSQDSPGENRTEKLIRLYIKRGRSFELISHFEDALQNYQEMTEFACECNVKTLELAAILAQATLHATPTPLYDLEKADKLAIQALSLARELNDREAEAKALWNLQLVNVFGQKPRPAIEYAEQSIAISRELNLREQLAYSLNDIQMAYRAIGEIDKTEAVIHEAQQLWKELNNIPMLIDSLGMVSINAYLRGDYEHVLRLSTEILDLSQSIGNKWGEVYGRWLLGYIYYDYGQPAKAIEVMQEGIRFSYEARFNSPGVFMKAGLGWIYGDLGAIDKGFEIIQSSLEKTENVVLNMDVDLLCSLAYLHHLKGDIETADELLQKVRAEINVEEPHTMVVLWLMLSSAEVMLAKQNYTQLIDFVDDSVHRLNRLRIGPFVPDMLYLKGKALVAQGNLDEAQHVFAEAQTKAEALNSRRILWRILSELSKIESDPTEAENLHQQSREIVESIIENMPAELRDSFLALQAVQEVK
jgi:serine/threonine protein kinase